MQRLHPECLRNVLSHRVTFVAMHSPLPLLQIDRIGRKVPVDDDVAVRVEVQPLLPNLG